MANSNYKLGCSGKFGIIFLGLIQIVRLGFVCTTFYLIYDSLIIKKTDSGLFDGPTTKRKATVKPIEEGNSYGEYDYENAWNPGLDLGIPDGNDSKVETELPHPTLAETFNVIDVFALIASMLDISMAILAIYTITVHLSRYVGWQRWVKWICKSRLIWMRMLWVTTAIIYAVLYVNYRKKKYEMNHFDTKFFDNNLVLARVYLTPVEYASLGLLETVSRIYTASRVNEKVKRGRLMIPQFWGRLAWLTYLLALFDFAIRNFSMSFYFGLYSVIMTDQDKDVPEMKNVLVVLQVYLAIMRGKFFQFFLRLFLSNYFYEDDDEQFDLKKNSKEQNGVELMIPANPDASSGDEGEGQNDKYAEWFDKDNEQENKPLKQV